MNELLDSSKRARFSRKSSVREHLCHPIPEIGFTYTRSTRKEIVEELSVYYWQSRKYRGDVAHLFAEGENVPWSVDVWSMCASPSLKAVAKLEGHSPKLFAASYDV